jgi:hypothetical protein
VNAIGKSIFGQTGTEQEVALYTLTNLNGLQVAITPRRLLPGAAALAGCTQQTIVRQHHSVSVLNKTVSRWHRYTAILVWVGHSQPRKKQGTNMVNRKGMHALVAGLLGGLVIGVVLAAARNPDLSGPWLIERPVKSLTTIDGLAPPLRAEATMRYMLIKEAAGKGDKKYDTMAGCLPPGVPRLSLQPMPWTIVQDEHHVLFVYEWNQLHRDVALEAEHVDGTGPSYLGQSVGKWEGKTLVVDTSGFNDKTLLDDSGLPHSAGLQTVERYRLTKGGKVLEMTVQITDAPSYLKPWETRVTFKKMPGMPIKEDNCLKRVGAL